MKRWIVFILLISFIALPVRADTIRWVDFGIPYESLKYAMDVDIDSFDKEKHISWIDILALAGCRTGGKCGLASVKNAVKDLKGDKAPQELLGEQYRYYDYYHNAYEAVLGGFLGCYSIEVDGEEKPCYGLKA